MTVCNARHRYAWRKLGYFDLAIADYTASLQMRKMEDQDSSNTTAEKSRSTHSADLKTYHNRAYSYAKMGLFKEAIKDYSMVRHTQPPPRLATRD